MFLFFFLVISRNFLTILVAREKIKVKIALAISAGILITLENEIIDTPTLVAQNTIEILSI